MIIVISCGDLFWFLEQILGLIIGLTVVSFNQVNLIQFSNEKIPPQIGELLIVSDPGSVTRNRS